MPLTLRKRTLGLFLIAITVLASGLYIIFDRFLMITGEEIVKAWFHGEIVNLQEGQVLSAIAKNQNLFDKSPFIRSVVLVDSKEPDRNLFSVGIQSSPVSKEIIESNGSTSNSISSSKNGFLSYRVVARLPGKNDLYIIYEISSSFLIWSYLATVAVGILFVSYLIGMTVKVNNIERRKREELRSDLLRRLSHDINSPLLSISGISLQVKKLDSELYGRIERATESIRQLFAHTDKVDRKILEGTIDLGSKLLPESAIDSDVEMVPIAAVLKELINQKRSEYAGDIELNIELVGLESILDKFVKINVEDFRRHFSNIFKNSVEATFGKSEKNISIAVSFKDNSLIVEVVDNGCGISEEVIPRIGQKGFSIGKTGGKGLGIHFAAESVKYWNGNLEIKSKLELGTKVCLSLPTFEKPSWYASEIRQKLNQKIVFIDDDTSMIDQWKNYLNLKADSYYNFNSVHSFLNWFHSGGQLEDNLLFIFDYHLDQNNIGLDIVEDLGISNESILVTSAFMNEEVISRARNLRVSLVPKILIG